MILISRGCMVLRIVRISGAWPQVKLRPIPTISRNGVSGNSGIRGSADGGNKRASSWIAAAIDPKTMAVTEIARGPSAAPYTGTAMAIPVGDTLWLNVSCKDPLLRIKRLGHQCALAAKHEMAAFISSGSRCIKGPSVVSKN